MNAAGHKVEDESGGLAVFGVLVREPDAKFSVFDFSYIEVVFGVVGADQDSNETAAIVFAVGLIAGLNANGFVVARLSVLQISCATCTCCSSDLFLKSSSEDSKPWSRSAVN